MDRSEALDILRRTKPELGRRICLKRLALFGSVARGEAGPDSDVDALVDFGFAEKTIAYTAGQHF